MTKRETELKAEKVYSKVSQHKKSKWSAKLAEGKEVSSVELLPPAGFDPEKILEKSREVKLNNVDAINIPDGPRASSRMSAMLTALTIEQKVEIETVLHYTCRDRNLLGMQSDLLGAQALGIRNILAVTGDPPKIGDFPDMTGVFDIDAIGGLSIKKEFLIDLLELPDYQTMSMEVCLDPRANMYIILQQIHQQIIEVFLKLN